MPHLKRALAIDVFAATMLTGWYYRHGFGHFHDSLYDTFDQKLVIYLLEWLNHCFFGSGHIANVFNPNIFYPNTDVLAWTEGFIGFLPVYSVARLASRNPVFALNCCAIACVFASCLGMLRFGRELTGRLSIVAAAVGAAGILAASQEGHFQLKGMCLVIWVLLLAVRFLRGTSGSLAATLAVCSWLLLTSLYCSVMLSVFLVSAALAALAAGRREFIDWLRHAFRRTLTKGTLVALAAGAAALAWEMPHYLRAMQRFGGYSMAEFIPFSARFGSLLDAPSSSLIYQSRYSDWGSHESKLFGGVLVWLFVLLLIVGWPRRQRLHRRPADPAVPRLRGAALHGSRVRSLSA